VGGAGPDGGGDQHAQPEGVLAVFGAAAAITEPDTGWPLGLQIVALGLVHVVNCAVVYTGVGAGARVVLRARPSAARVVTRISGAAMVGIGVFLVVERLIA
jgi:threonine/homoserine/homoserine lactone efflux protein